MAANELYEGTNIIQVLANPKLGKPKFDRKLMPMMIYLKIRNEDDLV